MARNRMLSPEFWLDEDLAKLSPHARLLYQGLWGICDDNYATLPNRPEWIKAQVFPYEKINITRLLTELSESGHLILFSSEEAEFWYIKNFFKHQKVEKPSKPKYPKFEANLRLVGEDSPNTLTEVKISKVKIREEKRESSSSYLQNVPPEDLQEFTKVYQCTERQVSSKGDDLFNYCQSHGKRYKDYKALLRNALKKDYGLRVQTAQFKPDLPDKVISPEKMAELKEKRERLLGTFVGRSLVRKAG